MAEKPEDLNLPASVVARIIKEALPEGVNVSKEAKSAIGRAASIFILYATTCANTYAVKGKRKTITPYDLFQAVEDMELQEFLPEMKECLEAFKKEQKEKKEAAADRKRKQTGAENVPDNSNPQNEELAGTADKVTTTTATINVSTEDTTTLSLHSQETDGNESQEEMETDNLPQFSNSLASRDERTGLS